MRRRPFSCVVKPTAGADASIDAFVAVDQGGRSFYADNEAAAAAMAEDYNFGREPTVRGVAGRCNNPACLTCSGGARV